MVAGFDRAVKIVRITDRYKEIDDFPSFLERRRTPHLKYDEAGNIYVSRWHTKKTEFDEEKKRRLVNPGGYDYEILDPRRHRDDYVNNLPLGIPVVELVWARVEGIETAIRKQKHILEAFDPKLPDGEVRLAQKVVEYVDKLSATFITESVDEEDLEKLADETEAFLSKNGLITPEDRNKRHIRDMLLRIPRTDSLGRVNPLVSRVRARAAYLAATRRLVMGSFVAEKFGSNLEILSYERELTRWALKTAVDQMDFYILSHSFIKSGVGGTDLQKNSLKDVIETLVIGHLATPRVKPYLGVSRFAQISLVGPNMGRGEMTKDVKIFGEEIVPSVYKLVPVSMLIDMDNHEKARARVQQIVSGIKDILDESE